MLNAVRQYTEDFLSLFFPDVCCACGGHLVTHENLICTSCIYDLPRTNFQLSDNSPVAVQFWGRVPFVYASAFLYFSSHSKVQSLIHHLKYKDRPELGVLLGEMYAKSIKNLILASGTDLIIPVPLHPSRLKERGYNQSSCIAEGLSSILGIPFKENYLLRNKATETQTRKLRFSRFENMQEVFSIDNPSELEGKHIVLVDDVITTGATIEACALKLLSVPGVRVSVLSLAFAH